MIQDPNWVGANDPNTTNIPYLAWRGEDVRLVQCFGAQDFTDIRSQETAGLSPNVAPVTDSQISNIFGSIVQTNVSMLDWSGVDTGSNQPHEVINGARTFLWYNFTENHPVICFQDTWDSLKAGLASFKLTVSLGLTNFDNTGVSIGSQVLVLQHQFLAGWMNLNAPTINEVPSISTTGSHQNPEGLGDATGDGKFFASNHWYMNSTGVWTYDPTTNTHLGEIRATVKGTLPLGQNFTELGIADADGNITLPDDWAKLARAGEPASDFATDGNRRNLNPAMRWDIHDEMVDQFGNVPAGTAGGRNGTGTTPKNVANVAADTSGVNPLTNTGDAWYSRNGVTTSQGVTTLPPSTYPTSGPFDPNYAGETLLPDGQLNSGDAPMPAARIDFSIAANTDNQHSIDGVGYFSSASKSHDYSLDYSGSNGTAGNLFVPYYSQYIPATGRDLLGYASGVDGAIITDNFPGFLNHDPTVPVPDWQAFTLDSPMGTQTACRLRGDTYGQTPSGPQTVAVYTDEHGEARVMYNPGTKFYFDAVNTIPGDSDKGCEFGQLLGTSNISVIARYPYQKTTDPDKIAKTIITKKVYNLFDKHLSDYPKNFNYASPNATYARIVLAYAQDYTGQALQGETVCFNAQQANQGNIPEQLLTGDVNINRPGGGSFTVHGNGLTSADPNMKDWLCTTTDSHGYAPFEYSTSFSDPVDVLAYFPEEGLYRDIKIDSAHPYQDNAPLTPEAALAAPPATAGAGANGTNAPSIDTIKAFGGYLPGLVVAAPVAAATVTPAATQTITPVTKITVKKAAIKLLALRLVRPAHGKAYFMIKVQSPNKTVKVILSLKNKSGKTVVKITKTIAANKLVKIHSSHIKLAIKRATFLLVK